MAKDTKKANYHVLMMGEGDAWILQLEPVTIAECERAIRWQHTGGNYQPMAVVTWDKVAGRFVDQNGQLHDAHKGCYKQEVWDAFMERLRNA